MKGKKARAESETPGGDTLCWFGDSGWGKGHLRPEEVNFNRSRKEVLERSGLGILCCKWREQQVQRSRGRGGVGPARSSRGQITEHPEGDGKDSGFYYR